MMNNSKDSKMLIEVWKMKEKLFEETQNMNSEELFEYINKKTEKTVSNLKKKAKV
ncbi:MAG: hypothetical protein JXB88_27270 [Spirochaetales bacterium]|nr:hypothetical protein [Spirochaetales bacterium]